MREYSLLTHLALLLSHLVLRLVVIVTPCLPRFPCCGVCRVAVTAWGDERPSTQCEDWPLTTATPGVSGETGCKPMP